MVIFHHLTVVMWEQNRGQCGVCGDAYHLDSPRPHEAGGLYAKGIISKFYAAGQVRGNIENSLNLFVTLNRFFPIILKAVLQFRQLTLKWN